MAKSLTIIIPELNEGTQLNDTLDGLFDTSDKKFYDVIVVSDGSKVPLDIEKYGKDVYHVHSKTRKGVGASFDIGAKLSESEYLITMGSDIRFLDNTYIERMLNHLEKEENSCSFICTGSKGINEQDMDVHRKSPVRYGARILFFIKAEDLPQRGSIVKQLVTEGRVATYRNILEAKWLTKEEGIIYEVPCVLGACYGVRKAWYDYIDGFAGHRRWGTLEPFISLKSWLAGGDCKVATDIVVAHIFKSVPSHTTYPHDLLYNKITLSKILFGDLSKLFINFLHTNENVEHAKFIVQDNMGEIDRLASNFESIRVRDIHWFYEKFPFKYYDLITNPGAWC